ncbi:hypothetical protein DFH06DRAFT_1136515 [Mycena polygramma]|nr:hypothetical protein DFH06DRAFT_1136515 [Mycena polygramma]
MRAVLDVGWKGPVMTGTAGNGGVWWRAVQPGERRTGGPKILNVHDDMVEGMAGTKRAGTAGPVAVVVSRRQQQQPKNGGRAHEPGSAGADGEDCIQAACRVTRADDAGTNRRLRAAGSGASEARAGFANAAGAERSRLQIQGDSQKDSSLSAIPHPRLPVLARALRKAILLDARAHIGAHNPVCADRGTLTRMAATRCCLRMGSFQVREAAASHNFGPCEIISSEITERGNADQPDRRTVREFRFAG